MAFKLCPRDPIEILFGQWRLATVKEVKRHIEETEEKKILGSGETVRLLDGWADGEGNIKKGFKSGIQKMLLVKTNVSRPGNGSLVPEMYSRVDLDTEGKYAAIKLSEEDKITEAIYLIKIKTIPMAFKLCARDPIEILFGQWRLATVEEVKKHIEETEEKKILGSGETVRLLDGWANGKSNIEKGFKSGIQKMLLVKTNVSRPGNGALVPEMYSGVDLDTEGKYAAIKSSEEDKITEAIYFVLHIHTEDKLRVQGIKGRQPNFGVGGIQGREAELDRLIHKIKMASGGKDY